MVARFLMERMRECWVELAIQKLTEMEYELYKRKLEAESRQRRKERMINTKARIQKIRQKEENKWTISDLRSMLSYKRKAGDKGVTNEKDKTVLLDMWNKRKNRPSPATSPIASDDEEDRKLTVAEMAAVATNGGYDEVADNDDFFFDADQGFV